MNDYRLYFLSAEDHVVRAQDLEGQDDAAALEAARVLDHAAAIEIWCGNRRVGRVTAA
jgi:hypothetical protein